MCRMYTSVNKPSCVDRLHFILMQTQAVVEKPQLCQSLHSACGLLKLGNRAPYIWSVEILGFTLTSFHIPSFLLIPLRINERDWEAHHQLQQLSLNWSTNLPWICNEGTQSIIMLLDRPKKWESKNAPGFEETVLHTIIAASVLPT